MDDSSKGFQLSTRTVDDTTSAMGATLKPVYDSVKTGKNDVAYIFYNDKSPDGKLLNSRLQTKNNTRGSESRVLPYLYSIWCQCQCGVSVYIPKVTQL